MDKINKKAQLFFKSIFIIFCYFAIQIFISSLFKDILINSNLIIKNLILIFEELLVLAIGIFYFRKTIIPDYYDFKNNYKQYLSENLKYYIIGLAIMFISNIIIGIFVNLPTNESVNREIILQFPIYSILSMCISGPILEELTTRKQFKDIFDNKYIYIIVSGLIFGSLHLLSASSINEIFYIIPYGALGATFAIIYNKTNNIWTSISYHTIHNTIAILLFLLMR